MTKLSIPLLLDLGTVLAASGLDQPDTAPVGPDGTTLLLPGDPGAVYELAAVLIHKGTSASHGHYGEPHSACTRTCLQACLHMLHVAAMVPLPWRRCHGPVVFSMLLQLLTVQPSTQKLRNNLTGCALLS